MNDHSAYGPRLKKFEHAVSNGHENYKYPNNVVGLTNMRNRQINGKLRSGLKRKSFSDRSKCDGKVIEQMVTTLDELKKKVNYFENYVMYEVAPEREYVNRLRKEEDHYVMGDTNDSKDLDTAERMKCANNSKTKGGSINPVLTSNSKGKSETSIVKSSISLTKNTYININPTMNPKLLKSAAQDFIKQAEELKSNITHMLDSENFDTVTVSDESEITVDPYSKEKYIANNQSNLQCLLLSVCSQYDKILKTLGHIQQHVQQSDVPDIHKSIKLSQTSAKVSSYIPDSAYKVETFKSDKMDTKVLCGNPNSMSGVRAPEASKMNKKKCKKKLDPVVLVYEPIKPSVCAQNVCAFCGYGSSSCLLENCRNCLMKSSFEKQDVSCGFMVSYTPNIHSTSGFISDPLKKDCRKLKKKKKSCLWF